MTALVDYIGVYWMTFIVITMLSYPLWKNNFLYRLGLNIYSAAFMGQLIALGVRRVYDTSFTPFIVRGQSIFILTVPLGIFVFSIYNERTRWLNRYPMAVMVGVSTGLTLATTVASEIIAQIKGNIVPLIGGSYTPLDNLIIIIGSICAFSYFFMTREHTGILKIPTTIGRWILMIVFGVGVASLTLSCLSYGIGALRTTYIALLENLGFA